MHDQLKKYWESLQEERIKLENEIKKANLVQQQFKPTSQSWNMLQVMAHLIASEKAGFDYLVKKNYSNSRKTNGKIHFLRAYFLRLMLTSPLRFKVPVPSLQPPEDNNYAELQGIWNNQRTIIANYLERFPEEKISHLVFRHPILGWLTISQTLGFYKDHIRHHRHQIKRIKNSAEFPK